MDARTIATGCCTKFGFGLLLAVVACSDEGSTTNASEATGGTGAGIGGSAGAGAGANAGSSGVAATGGAGSTATAGGGATGAGTAGSTPEAGGSGGGGEAIAGAGGMAAGGSGGQGGDAGNIAGDCTRDLLTSTIDAYFRALAAHDPASLPLADDVKFTENGEVLEVGQGLWQNAGMVKYAQSALDTGTCGSATQAVVPDGGMDIPFALRIQLADQRIAEVETIAVRPGDYQAFGSDFPSDTSAIIAADDAVGWEQPVPADQRNTREQIASWIDKYFRIFPRGVCNVASGCKRLENGGGSFDCSLGASCDPGPPGSGPPVMEPRLILVDVETGIGVGLTLFMGNTDMHMYKMHADQVHAVHAILGAASSSGWD
jgi:hypothetical protein